MRGFRTVHPTAVLVYFLTVLTVAMFTLHPVVQGLALLGGALFACRMPRGVLRPWSYPLLFLLITLSNPLFSHEGETVLFRLGQLPVTVESLAYGAGLATTLLGTLLWCGCMSRLLTGEKLMAAFGGRMPRLTLLISMILGFIPRFFRRLHTLGQLHRGEGNGLRHAARLLTAAISYSLEEGLVTAASMSARGYGLAGHSSFTLYRLHHWDGALMGLSVALAAVTLGGLGANPFAYYPRITPVATQPAALAAYAACGLLMFIPCMLEAKEALKWRYYASKI